MAGTDSRFSAAAFREAIHFAMNMGLPNSVSERATFVWDTEQTFDTADSSGKPFIWDDTPASETVFSDVQIPVGVEVLSKGGDTMDTRVGQFDVTRVRLVVLDEDYPSLTQNGVMANKVRFDDATYDIQFVEPPVGLFDVTVYLIHAQAIDES